jgi:hypothetical protein
VFTHVIATISGLLNLAPWNFIAWFGRKRRATRREWERLLEPGWQGLWNSSWVIPLHTLLHDSHNFYFVVFGCDISGDSRSVLFEVGGAAYTVHSAAGAFLFGCLSVFFEVMARADSRGLKAKYFFFALFVGWIHLGASDATKVDIMKLPIWVITTVVACLRVVFGGTEGAGKDAGK